MTAQPRDLAAELQQIISADAQFSDTEIEAAITSRLLRQRRTLLLHIAALSRELEELRKPAIAPASPEVERLRTENERLTKQIEHLDACNSRQANTIAALRRPVEQGYAQDVRQYVSTKTLHEPCHSHFDVLLSALDATARQLRERGEMLEAAQREILTIHRWRQLYTDLMVDYEKQKAEIARLSSPPEPLAPIATQIMRWMSANDAWRAHPELSENITKLIDGCANLRNAHQDRVAMLSVVQDALTQRNRECAELRESRGRLEQHLRWIDDLVTRDADGPVAPKKAAYSWETVAMMACDYAHAGLAASQQHTAGSGDGVAGEQETDSMDPKYWCCLCEKKFLTVEGRDHHEEACTGNDVTAATGRYGIDQGQFLASCGGGNAAFGERNSGGTPE